MREFRDNQGRPWQLALTVSSALRVRDLVRCAFAKTDAAGNVTGEVEERPLDLLDTANVGQTLQVLRQNFSALGETVYAILGPQVASKGLDRDSFLDGLAGDSLDAARSALEDELVGFFPSRLRGLVGSMRERLTELETAMVDQATATIAAVELPGRSSGSVPASSASTPANGPSANSSPLLEVD